MKDKVKDKAVGVKYNPKNVYVADILFTGCVDGIIFGICNHKAFDNAKVDWPLIDKIRWAEGNALFFQDLANKLNLWVKAIEEGSV